MRTTSRRAMGVIAGVVTALSASACSSGNATKNASAGSTATTATQASGTATTSGKPQTITPINLACAPTITGLPIEYAMENGLDVKNGIKIACQQVTSGPEEVAAMISGAINVAGLNPSNFFPVLDRGTKMVAFEPVLAVPFFDLIVRKGFPLPDQAQGWKGVMKDLEHAKIGVVARGAAAEDLARALFQYAGLPDNQATYIATGLATTTLAAMSKGQIDAAMTFEPGITLAVSQGIATEPFSIEEHTGPPQMDSWGSLMYTTTATYAQSNMATLKKFQTTYEQGLAWVENPANKNAVVALTEKYLGLSAAVATALVNRNLPFFSKATTIQASSYNALGDFYYKMGVAKKDYHVSDYAINLANTP